MPNTTLELWGLLVLGKDLRHMGTKESQVLTVKIGPVLCH